MKDIISCELDNSMKIGYYEYNDGFKAIYNVSSAYFVVFSMFPV